MLSPLSAALCLPSPPALPSGMGEINAFYGDKILSMAVALAQREVWGLDHRPGLG